MQITNAEVGIQISKKLLSYRKKAYGVLLKTLFFLNIEIVKSIILSSFLFQGSVFLSSFSIPLLKYQSNGIRKYI